MDQAKFNKTTEKDTKNDFKLAYDTNHKVFAGRFNRQEMIQFYNKWAADNTYDLHLNKERYPGPSYVAQAMASYFSAKERSSVRVLDVAAGTGQLGAELFQNGFRHIVALDPSSGMLEQAKKRGIYEDFINTFIGFENSIPVQSDSYDGVAVCGGFGEGHIPCDALVEMIRVVKPEGVICFAIRQEYLKEQQYNGALEPFMKTLEEEEKWKLKSKTTIENFAFGKPGFLYLFNVS